MLSKEQRDRIDNGAKFLDEVMPGWAGKINTLELNVDSFKNCVLGQLYGSFWEGMRRLGHNPEWHDLYDDDGFCVSNGFYPSMGDAGAYWLEKVAGAADRTAYWLEKVAERV